jgi:hypothetical protein
MKYHAAIALAALLVAGSAAAQPPAPSARPPAAAARKLTVDSLVKDLIANPKTDAVLKAQIPETRANEQFSTMGAELPLREIAQYDPALTPAKLKQIDDELAKVQASN